ncbi:MAG: hypothetical protein PHX72_02515 [Candidatus Shapirobacteria bacterium]|nr:hypothetical protein [Candidatus Shapirobacteria bacterium]
MRKVNHNRILVIVLFFLIAFLEAVFVSWPITLVFLIVLAFYWEEKAFLWALLIGLWQDLISWRHLGSRSLIFLLASFLVIVIKHRVVGQGQSKLSLPKQYD